MADLRLPVSTYRVQFNPAFEFRDARAIVEYLHTLGITDLYASPVLKSRRGSAHGYDVTDPARLDPELGSEQDFDALSDALTSREMGMLLDIVPNHMAASVENPWWADVLENGQDSPYAFFFDIDWNADDGKALLPILGRPYGEALENGELSLALDDDGIYLRYYDNRLPLNKVSLDAIQSAVGDTGLRPEQLNAFNGVKGNPSSFDTLDKLISQQHYRLAYWKLASEGINYRRFFDISDLAGVRVESPEVFEAMHHLILILIREGRVTGLRLDHIDGLHDPAGYLDRLQDAVCSQVEESNAQHRFYVVVEKILTEGEKLADDWPIAGSTGYDFLNAVNSLFVSESGLEKLKLSYTRFAGYEGSFEDMAYEKKRRVIYDLFSGELRSLTVMLSSIAGYDRHACDIPQSRLMTALAEVTACLPVYRTYTNTFEVSVQDKRTVEHAFEQAQKRRHELDDRAVDFLHRALLLELPPNANENQRSEWLGFVMRWQQFSGPVTAKGVEDTALYNYNCLISLNDVGGEPNLSEFSSESLHRFNKARQADWSHTMNATSTHDTKRSEDVRARINVLSELADEWQMRVLRWSRWNEACKPTVDGNPIPDANTELLIYQTMVGAWPLSQRDMPEFGARLKAYVIKAAREAKVLTNWLLPNEANESALQSFVDAIIDHPVHSRFLADFRLFQKKGAFYGAINSLSQVLIKSASPGVPDFYQGTELWDFSLVDPDNRRPVNYERRKELLDDVIRREGSDRRALIKEMLGNWEDGQVKLYLTYKVLSARKNYTPVFLDGEYIPFKAEGQLNEHVFAFARRLGNDWIIAAAPRLAVGLCESGAFPLGEACWGDCSLSLPANAPANWHNLLTGESLEIHSSAAGDILLRLSEVFSQFPVVLLAGRG
jgi:(1->4)-alpha-D-glucan 1-alpha-D-glucosylmutase